MRKSQVTLKYEDNKIVGVDAVVLSTQHSEEVSQKEIYEGRDGRNHQANFAK